MARVLTLLAITACAFALVAYVAQHPEWWEPMLEAQGIDRDSRTFRSGAKLILAIVVGLPLTALIHAIGRLGSNRARTDIHGYKVLRLRAGTRYFLTFSTLCIAAMFFALPIVDPTTKAPWAFQLGGIVTVFFALVLLTARIRYDNATLSVSGNLGGQKRFQWADLTDIQELPDLKRYVLVFKNGRKASISFNYAGVDDLIETAQAKLGAYARIARSRNGQVGA